MRDFFYFVFGIMFAIVAVLFGIEHYGREFIQDYWIERMWYGDLEQAYEATKTAAIIIFLIFVIAWTYHKGRDAAHQVSNEFMEDNNND